MTISDATPDLGVKKFGMVANRPMSPEASGEASDGASDKSPIDPWSSSSRHAAL